MVKYNVVFLYCVILVRDMESKLTLYKLALYHLWELRQEVTVTGDPTIGGQRTLLKLCVGAGHPLRIPSLTHVIVPFVLFHCQIYLRLGSSGMPGITS